MRAKFWVRPVLVAVLLGILGGCSKGDPGQNLRASEAFMVENAKKPGVLVTASGLQYQILQPGGGMQPSAADSVTVNYKGSLIDGTVFDDGEGISFPLNGVISGWTEGLQLMKEGAKYRFFIPPDLAYGESGAGRVIPPNAALIFEVDLLKVNR
jgi:FKBP-type peptidyl-prolyl cis-trans isomerase